MEPVYELNGLRIVDLTKVLDPKTESRRCHLIRYNTGGPIPDFHTALDLTSTSAPTASVRIIILRMASPSASCR